MVVVCANCKRKYQIDTSRIPAGGTSFTCWSCRAAVRVETPGHQPSIPPPPPPQSPSPRPLLQHPQPPAQQAAGSSKVPPAAMRFFESLAAEVPQKESPSAPLPPIPESPVPPVPNPVKQPDAPVATAPPFFSNLAASSEPGTQRPLDPDELPTNRLQGAMGSGPLRPPRPASPRADIFQSDQILDLPNIEFKPEPEPEPPSQEPIFTFETENLPVSRPPAPPAAPPPPARQAPTTTPVAPRVDVQPQQRIASEPPVDRTRAYEAPPPVISDPFPRPQPSESVTTASFSQIPPSTPGGSGSTTAPWPRIKGDTASLEGQEGNSSGDAQETEPLPPPAPPTTVSGSGVISPQEFGFRPSTPTPPVAPPAMRPPEPPRPSIPPPSSVSTTPMPAPAAIPPKPLDSTTPVETVVIPPPQRKPQHVSPADVASGASQPWVAPIVEPEEPRAQRSGKLFMALVALLVLVVGAGLVWQFFLQDYLFPVQPAKPVAQAPKKNPTPTPPPANNTAPVQDPKAGQTPPDPPTQPIQPDKPPDKPPQPDVPTTGPTNSSGSFTLQLRSSPDQNDAGSAVEKLKAAGFDAYVMKADLGKKGIWYRVRVGRFDTSDEARKIGSKVRSGGLASEFIVVAYEAP